MSLYLYLYILPTSTHPNGMASKAQAWWTGASSAQCERDKLAARQRITTYIRLLQNLDFIDSFLKEKK
jgi:hypothetical protein